MIGLLAAAALGLSRLAGAPPAVHEEIVVVAARRAEPLAGTGAAVSTLDAAAVARLPATTVADAVALLPGFHVLFDAPFGGVPMESARGFFGGGEAGYVQLRVDGVPLADAESGAPEWNAIPAAAVERVEALRGPSSPLYGDAAFGGVVELRTRRAREGPALAAGLAGGSFGTAAADARVAKTGATLAAALDLEGRRTDGYRDHAAERSGAVRLRLEPAAPAEADWRAVVGRWSATREEPGPLPFAQIARDPRASDPAFAADRSREERWDAAATWQRTGAVGAELRLSGEARELAALRTLLLAAGFADSTWRRLDGDGLGAAAILEGARGRLDWTGGLELGRDRIDSAHHAVTATGAAGGLLERARVTRERGAAFAALAADAPGRLRLHLALRRDDVRDARGGDVTHHDAWSPRAGLSWRPLPARPWVAFAHWGESFKAPTLDQLFDPRPFPDGAGGTFTLANAGLRPQRAETLEVGGRGFGLAASWSATAYRSAVTDEIDFDPVSFRYVNLGSSLHRGVELSGDLVRLARARVGAGWEWSEVFARSGENAGRQLKNVPEHTVRLLVALGLPREVEVTLTGRHLAGRALDDARRYPLGDATLVDLRVRRQWRTWEAHVDVRNLLDDDFLWVGHALPDLAGGTVPYAYPGHGRAVLVGVRWRRATRAAGGS